MKKNKRIVTVTYSAVIAAVYVILTYLASFLGIASGAVQCRLSEAMCVLPAFTPAGIPGLFIGCMLSNILTGCILPDIVFGSLATLIGALGTYLLRNKSKYLLPLPAIAANTLIMPFVLKFSYGAEGALWYFFLTIAAGEIISCGMLGILLYNSLEKHKSTLF